LVEGAGRVARGTGVAAVGAFGAVWYIGAGAVIAASLSGIAVSLGTGSAGAGANEACTAGGTNAGFSAGPSTGAAGSNELPMSVRLAAIPTSARSGTSRTRSDRLDDSVDSVDGIR